MMNFELLPNEILLDFFEYLSAIHLFYAFSSLNSRFNTLLYEQFQRFHLDFQQISKSKFNDICQNCLPSIINQSISLHLSNDDDTPQQIELFLSHYSQFHRFIHLQSMSLTYLRSQETLNQIMLECAQLPYLTHLTFTYCFISMSQNDANCFVNQIWSLPNLTYCYLDICFGSESYFSNPIVISRSLRYLIIQESVRSSLTLIHLCQYTPNLQYLSTIFAVDPHQLGFSFSFLPITRLKIIFNNSINMFRDLLQNMPNLYHLTWEALFIYMNGYQWEEMIKKYLLKLKIFRFKTQITPLNNEDREVQINEIVDSFRTRFWIDEHQWFVRCHWYSPDEQYHHDSIDLFTLPYTFDNFRTSDNCILAKTTCPYDDEYLICNHVISLHCGFSDFNDSILSRVRFLNIQYLSLSLPFNNLFLSVVCKLDRLTSLSVWIYNNDAIEHIQTQLQFLLARASRLHSLNLDSRFSSILHALLIESTSKSIRRLNLQGCFSGKNQHCFDEEQCIQLSRFPLGKQCETLLIEVKNRRNILDLVNNMPNLQALNVRCAENNWTDENDSVSSGHDELVEWLREQLPSTSMITRDKYDYDKIRLWIC
ncbi:unnamed protein product [Rotaria sordida]|uniref:F-box domain-containing protein n=1 Tax=Rotaria sordida TaxID=392033 RepID=A0A815DPR9_9BILA|nr:unnamed protein product [Rotaria sordida]CAF1300342.1 unnamed protein product [Rotaria sordida]